MGIQLRQVAGIRKHNALIIYESGEFLSSHKQLAVWADVHP